MSEFDLIVVRSDVTESAWTPPSGLWAALVRVHVMRRAGEDFLRRHALVRPSSFEELAELDAARKVEG